MNYSDVMQVPLSGDPVDALLLLPPPIVLVSVTPFHNLSTIPFVFWA